MGKGRSLLRLAAYVVLVASGGAIVWSSRLYFLDPIRIHFLMERPVLAADRIWRACLAIHVAGGVGCLVSLLVASVTAFSAKWKTTHRWSGRLYAVFVLLLLCPSGLFLSAYAKGGFAGKFGFLLLCGLTFGFTWLGVRTAIEGKYASHRRWMTRSMAMAATAMTFRLCQLALAQTALTPEGIYVASLYVSTFGNWLVAEIWLGHRFQFASHSFLTKNSLETEI